VSAAGACNVLPGFVAGFVEQRQGGFGEVALVGDLPFVVGFDEDRAGQAQQRSGVGKDSHDASLTTLGNERQ